MLDHRAESAILEAKELAVDRGGVRVLTDVDLRVLPGQRVALIGPSGAGKTSLLRCLAGLESAAQGEVKAHVESGTNVGMVFQDLGLFPHMRVWSNVAFPLLAKRRSRRERKRAAFAALRKAGLEHLASRRPNAISGGERQRVALVRTLLSDPDVVLLDEPFSSLDSHLVGRFTEWLGDLQAETGIALVIATHDVTFVLGWADYIVLLNEGTVVQHGAPDVVFERPRSSFAAQFLGPCNVMAGRVTFRRNGLTGKEIEITTDLGLVARVGSHNPPPEELPERVLLCIRPASFTVCAPSVGMDDRQLFVVVDVAYRGTFTTYEIESVPTPGFHLRVDQPNVTGRYSVGEQVMLEWPPRRLCLVIE
ncbi:MAG: ABC transporter ATP-binding protein [bacterium]|nr:ABC transporter ATP-binding protein [bacterium]MCP4967330.1 ABC transporter ATP-binding protein [bacterium]